MVQWIHLGSIIARLLQVFFPFLMIQPFRLQKNGDEEKMNMCKIEYAQNRVSCLQCVTYSLGFMQRH